MSRTENIYGANIYLENAKSEITLSPPGRPEDPYRRGRVNGANGMEYSVETVGESFLGKETNIGRGGTGGGTGPAILDRYFESAWNGKRFTKTNPNDNGHRVEASFDGLNRAGAAWNNNIGIFFSGEYVETNVWVQDNADPNYMYGNWMTSIEFRQRYPWFGDITA